MNAAKLLLIWNNHRNKGLGKKLFERISNFAQNIGYEATELNTYIKNEKSHQFYKNEDYKKLGYHYLKKY